MITHTDSRIQSFKQNVCVCEINERKESQFILKCFLQINKNQLSKIRSTQHWQYVTNTQKWMNKMFKWNAICHYVAINYTFFTRFVVSVFLYLHFLRKFACLNNTSFDELIVVKIENLYILGIKYNGKIVLSQFYWKCLVFLCVKWFEYVKPYRNSFAKCLRIFQKKS